MGEKTELMTVENIYNRVYVIRGQQVMLDTDLAKIYGYEVEELRLQNVTANINSMSRTRLFVFTGVDKVI